MEDTPQKKAEGDTTQSRQLKRNLLFIAITLIVILLFLGSSVFFYLQRSEGKGSQLATNRETPVPTSTPTSIYLETPPVKSEFYDTFKNNALGWSVSSTEGYQRSVKPGKLTLINTNRGTTMVESLPTNSIFDNCIVIVDLTILEANLGDSVGIYFRGDTSLEHDYRMDLYSNGTFDIAKEYLDSRNNPQSVILVGPNRDSALNPPGENNTIALTMNGSQLQLFINNAFAISVTDSDYLSGQVALFTRLGENSQIVTASFSKVEIDKLQKAGAG